MRSEPRTMFALLGTMLLLLSARLFGQTTTVPEYRVSFPDRENHYLQVVADISTEGRASVELWMAVWTPGSYKIRDYSRHVESLAAFTPSGSQLPIDKFEKSRWRVHCPGLDRIQLRYRVYGREMSVRTNFVERDFAMLNGAATWVVPWIAGASSSTLVGIDPREPKTPEYPAPGPFDVRFILPTEWAHCETGLPPHPSGDPHRYLVPDYDTLVDCPVVIGNLDIRTFEVEGVPHHLVSQGGRELWDFAKAAEDCQRVVEAQAELWGTVPYSSYRFLNMIVEAGGGLEHKNSTLMMSSRYSFRDEDRYRSWLGLVSHEFYHTWNVKRLRPIALGPFDYTREVHTDDLWVVEGITSYYDDLVLARSGLTNRKQYLKALSGQIEGVQTTPGREVHALSDTSHDAWTHYYQRNENSRNTTISYYTKGAVVGFLLDLEIRRASDGAKSLDDAMRLAYSRFSGERGYTSEEFRACCSEVAGQDLSGFFARAVDSKEELEYAGALEWLGLRFKPAEKSDAEKEEVAEGSEETEEPAPEETEAANAEKKPERKSGWIGLRVSDRGGRLIVTEVRRNTIAYEAGLNVDDEVIALDGLRLPSGGWGSRMKQYEPGDTVELLISRRGSLRTIDLTLGEKPEESWKLDVVKEPTPEQTTRLATWLGEAGSDLLEKAKKQAEEDAATSETPEGSKNGPPANGGGQ